MLRDELLAMGFADARQDEHGIVTPPSRATSPARRPSRSTRTSIRRPETTGKNVNPQVIRDYPGGDIVLPKDPTEGHPRRARTRSLNALVGKTIITTDGTTLLGGDDKAGVAVIMEAARILAENPDVPHGPVRVVFTCDEEIGNGVITSTRRTLGAVVAYTLDGTGTGEIEGETFSADKATVTITGVNIHPAIAKGRMVNAIRLAGLFLDRLPRRCLSPGDDRRPRRASSTRTSSRAASAKMKIRFLLRDFDTPKLAEQAELLREIGRQIEREYPEAKVEVAMTKQYRNMRDGIAQGAAGGAVRRGGDRAGPGWSRSSRSSAAAPTARS